LEGQILDATKIKDLKVLYLAKYADYGGDQSKAPTEQDKIVIKYNGEIASVLSELFPKLTCSSKPSTVLDKDLKKKYDYVLSLYNRMPFRNSEIFVSAVLEYHDVSYFGARPNIRAIAEDKVYSKIMAKHIGVPTPDWHTYDKYSRNISEPPFPGPFFVKPRFGAASENITTESFCEDWYDAQTQINMLMKKGIEVIVEEAVCGTAFSQPILWNYGMPLLLPLIKEKSNNIGGIITNDQKRKVTGGLQREVACKHDSDLLSKYTERIFNFIDPTDYIRADYMITDDGQPFFLEFNVCANLGSHAAIALSADSVGISHRDLIRNIVYSSIFRNNISKLLF